MLSRLYPLCSDADWHSSIASFNLHILKSALNLYQSLTPQMSGIQLSSPHST